jgi:hypothetical protein
MTIEIGDTLGRYTIQGVIGRGGMANVHKAFQPALERVAVKVTATAGGVTFVAQYEVK